VVVPERRAAAAFHQQHHMVAVAGKPRTSSWRRDRQRERLCSIHVHAIDTCAVQAHNVSMNDPVFPNEFDAPGEADDR